MNGQSVVALGVPIVRDGKVAYCLQGLVGSGVLNSLLQSGNLPEGWIAAIVAANGLLVARSRTPELFVGQKASARVIAALDQRRLDIFDGYTREDIPTRTALRAVGDWGWHVALAVPRQELMAPLDRELRDLALLALALIGASCAMVIYVSRRIGRSLRQTVRATHAVLAGQTPEPSVSGITELDHMHDALTHIDAYGRILEQQVSARTQELLDAKQRIASFANQLDESIEAERQRLSREVHDQIGAVLTGIKMIFRSLPPDRLPQADEKALLDALDTGVATARRIASELRPPLIDDIGLQAAVEHLLDGILRPAQVLFSVKLADCARLTPRQSLAAFRIIQEAATNVARHASAGHFAVAGRSAGNGYEFTMIDDGVGLAASGTHAGRLGLVGMQERAQLLGGCLTWVSQPQQGTAFTLTIPLEPTDS